jgi:hypothetical protein
MWSITRRRRALCEVEYGSFGSAVVHRLARIDTMPTLRCLRCLSGLEDVFKNGICRRLRWSRAFYGVAATSHFSVNRGQNYVYMIQTTSIFNPSLARPSPKPRSKYQDADEYLKTNLLRNACEAKNDHHKLLLPCAINVHLPDKPRSWYDIAS